MSQTNNRPSAPMSPYSVMSRRTFLARSALAAGLASTPLRALAAPAPSALAAASEAAVVSAAPAQVMQGFGAAGAWWPNDLVKFAPDVREWVADLLFGRDGIALSVYRYNIGGGGVGVLNPVRAPETHLLEPGVYDWGRDPGGRLFLQLAAERGVPILLGFVNSAPPVWTTNGQSCGGSLSPGAESAFGRYLVDVVEHIHEGQGIELAFVSPMNEPDYSFESAGQEGMRVPVEQRAALVRAVYRELEERAPYCRLIADESSRTGEHFLGESSRWLESSDAASYIAAFAQHRYDFPNDGILRLSRELSEDYDRPLWCTEICCFDTRTGAWGQQYDPTIRGGLMMANLIAQGLIWANDAAFHWWVACSSEIGADPVTNPDAAYLTNGYGWNDGLLYYDPQYARNGNQQIYVTKRFYVLGQFSRYVRPGARRHDVLGAPPHVTALAFQTSTGRAALLRETEWALILINNGRPGSSPTPVELQFPRDEASPLVPGLAVQTSETRDLSPVDLPIVQPDGNVTCVVPSQSITTYVLRQSARAPLAPPTS